MTELPLNQILMGDTLQILPTLPKKSVDLIFADPPYNLQLQQELWRPNLTRVDAVNDSWDQIGSFAQYDEFTRAWLIAARRVMKDTASIWISGTYHNIFRVGSMLQDLGFWILNTITWFKPNAMPNFRGTRLKNDVEFVIWAKHSEKGRYTFNHHLMKQFNNGKQLGSVWTIPVCGGQERLKDSEGRKLHSTQKPEELLRRIILASSKPGDVILDPFIGTGTTAAVAKQLHRQWIGIEQDTVYAHAARMRIEQTQQLLFSDQLLAESDRGSNKRIPFTSLITQGLLIPGQLLYLDKPENTATILEDGQVKSNGFVGSIHRVGAQLKNAPSCNGWMHWQYFNDDLHQYQPIDVLRKRVLALNQD
jgi:DNA modification methylase